MELKTSISAIIYFDKSCLWFSFGLSSISVAILSPALASINGTIVVSNWRVIRDNIWPPFPTIFCHNFYRPVVGRAILSRESLTPLMELKLTNAPHAGRNIFSRETTSIPNYYGKESKPYTTPCLSKAHLVTARSNESTLTSIGTPTSLP